GTRSTPDCGPRLRIRTVHADRSQADPPEPLAFALHALLAGDLTFAGYIELGAADRDLTVARVMSDHDARARHARSRQRVRVRRRAVGKELLAAAEHHRDGEDGHRVDEVVG